MAEHATLDRDFHVPIYKVLKKQEERGLVESECHISKKNRVMKIYSDR